MSFSAEWLALRQHADSAARPAALAQSLAQWLHHHPDPTRSLVVDLGSGSGANCLHLADHLSPDQPWLLVDHDAALLRRAQSRCIGRATVTTLQCDLAAELAQLPWTHARLVTASALLDLVSAQWLAQLVDLAAAQRLPLLLALSYDGRISLAPAHEDDSWLRDTVNAHQRSDKGFGAALGPLGASHCAGLLRDRGYWVQLHASDWVLSADDPRDAALLHPLLAGWAEAAAHWDPAQQPRALHWLQHRVAQLEAGTVQVRVGHQDLLALPPPA